MEEISIPRIDAQRILDNGPAIHPAVFQPTVLVSRWFRARPLVEDRSIRLSASGPRGDRRRTLPRDNRCVSDSDYGGVDIAAASRHLPDIIPRTAAGSLGQRGRIRGCTAVHGGKEPAEVNDTRRHRSEWR